jgi:hypothetical protein
MTVNVLPLNQLQTVTHSLYPAMFEWTAGSVVPQ